MLHHRRFPNVVFGASLRPESAALAIMVLLLFLLFVFLFMTLTAQPVQAQTYKVIYNFTGGQDGAVPYTGLTMDRAGNFYGTTLNGGSTGNGTVFRLSRKGSGWVLTPLYSFQGGTDGAYPYARVVFGPDGSLYGTTGGGGYYVGDCASSGCGTVYKLSVPPTVSPAALSPWRETVLSRFSDGSDGGGPGTGSLAFDQAGNIYGTTTQGGSYEGMNCASAGCGTIFELTPSNGGWTKSVLYSFTDGSDGMRPWSGVIFDRAGNLYGTTSYGGPAYGGTVYQLQPSGSGWAFNTLYGLGNDADSPTLSWTAPAISTAPPDLEAPEIKGRRSR